MRLLQSLFFIALSFVAFSLSLVAEPLKDPDLEVRARSVFMQILSPFCPGRSLGDCPSSKANQLKDQIRTDIEGGKTETEILASIYATYGEQYRAVPKPEGFGLAVWLVPFGFLLVGGIMIWFRMGGTRNSAPASDIVRDPRVERELEKDRL